MQQCNHIFKQLKESSSFRTNDGTRVDISGYYWCPKCGTLKEYHSGSEVLIAPNTEWEDIDPQEDATYYQGRLPQRIMKD